MTLDGLTPSQGPNPLDPPSKQRKAETKAGGKSFADALGKARAGTAPAAPAAPSEPAKPATEAMPPMEDHMSTVRFRLQSGYYNNPKIADELSDKLSGYFDDLA